MKQWLRFHTFGLPLTLMLLRGSLGSWQWLWSTHPPILMSNWRTTGSCGCFHPFCWKTGKSESNELIDKHHRETPILVPNVQVNTKGNHIFTKPVKHIKILSQNLSVCQTKMSNKTLTKIWHKNKNKHFIRFKVGTFSISIPRNLSPWT